MRHRSLATLGLLGAVVMVLGGLLIGRLMPPDGGDGQVDPVIISPAGLVEDGTSAPPTGTPSPDATATTEPTEPTEPTVRPSTRAPAPAKPTQVKPKPKPVDDDDDDDDGPDDDDPDDDRDDD